MNTPVGDQSYELEGRSADRGTPSVAYLLVLAAAVLITYGPLLVWMVERWWKSEYYGHGFLIPLISAYLIWQQRDRLKNLPRHGFGWGLVIIAASLLLHFCAIYRLVNFPSGFALVGTIFGLVVWLGGWPLGRAIAFPVGFLVFMVPTARLLIELFAQPLQLLSAQSAGYAMAALGSDVVIEGTIIHTAQYSFEVAIPCSGLKTIIAMTALAALFAYLVAAPWWKKLVIFVAAFPVALAANAARIFITLVLGQTLGPATAEGFFHSVSGMIVFLFGLAGLFLVGRALNCLQMRDDM